MTTGQVLGAVLGGLALIAIVAGAVAFFRVKLSGATIENYEIANRAQKARMDALEDANEDKQKQVDALMERLAHQDEKAERQEREIHTLQQLVLQRAEVAAVVAALKDHDAQAARRHEAIIKDLNELRRRAKLD